MPCRLIACDIDGTLLTTDKRITHAVEDAVRRAQAAGAAFCLSSGRPLCGLKSFAERLAPEAPAMTCNGSAILTPDGTVLAERCLEPDAAMEIIGFAERFDVTACVWSHERLFVNRFNERTLDYQRMSPQPPRQIKDFSGVCAEGVNKILWYSDAESVRRFVKTLDAELSAPVRYFTSNPAFLEFVDEDVSKAKALEWLARYFGCAMDETLAIGDGFNDLEMLCAAGTGVAMGNAPDGIKRRCAWTAPSNDEDGVAAAIEKFVLNKA